MTTPTPHHFSGGIQTKGRLSCEVGGSATRINYTPTTQKLLLVN